VFRPPCNDVSKEFQKHVLKLVLRIGQALMGGAGAGYEAFLRACTKTGIFGFLAAFIVGFLAYGLALTLATIVLKWLIVQQMHAGVHKCDPALYVSITFGLLL
jgi:hypothetical protein